MSNVYLDPRAGDLRINVLRLVRRLGSLAAVICLVAAAAPLTASVAEVEDNDTEDVPPHASSSARENSAPSPARPAPIHCATSSVMWQGHSDLRTGSCRWHRHTSPTSGFMEMRPRVPLLRCKQLGRQDAHRLRRNGGENQRSLVIPTYRCSGHRRSLPFCFQSQVLRHT
jgi:hypothetical protein